MLTDHPAEIKKYIVDVKAANNEEAKKNCPAPL